MGLLDGLFGTQNGYDQASNSINQSRALLNAVPLPQYQQWNPNLINTENANYQLTSDNPVDKSLQSQALAQMAGLAQNGLSAVDAQGLANARDQANEIERSGNQAAMQDAQNRGVGGSGMEFAMREMGNQGAAEAARKSGMDAAAQAAQQRALYAQMYGQQLGQQRSQDYQTNANNANIINQFNQANTATRNQAAAANTGLQNQAFQYNQGLQDKNFQNQMTKVTGQTQLNDQQAKINAAQQDAQTKRNAGIGGLVGTGIGGAFGGAPGAAIGAGVGSALF